MKTPTLVVVSLRIGLPIAEGSNATAQISEAHKLVGDVQGAARMRNAQVVVDEVVFA